MSGVDYTVTLDLSFSGNLSKGLQVLTQTPRGTLPAPFAMDSFGRISVPSQGGEVTDSVSVTLSRSVTAGASGTLLIRGVDSPVAPLAADPDTIEVRVPFDGGAQNAQASGSGLHPNLLARSLEIVIEFTGGANVGVIAPSTISLSLHIEEQHTCSAYDPGTGYRVHRQVLAIQPSASSIGPALGWCSWCHEIVVTSEP